MYCVIAYPNTLIRVVKNIKYLLINYIALL